MKCSTSPDSFHTAQRSPTLFQHLLRWASPTLVVFACGCVVETSDVDEDTYGEKPAEIVGGTATSQTNIPWQVMVVLDGGVGVCGGTILDKRWVLTAAHCVEGYDAGEVLVGTDVLYIAHTYAASWHSVRRVHTPAQFVSVRKGNDIALLELDEDLDTPELSIEPIRVATFADAEAFAPGKLGTASGWGKTREGGEISTVLRTVDLPIVPIPIAQEADSDVPADNIAAGRWNVGGVGTCRGDSGGPLTVMTPRGRAVVGISSWTIQCGAPTSMSMFTNVAWHADWIFRTMRRNRHGEWRVDTNRDGNRDLTYRYGLAADRPITGDFNKDGRMDLGLLRIVDSKWQWIIDTNRDNVTNLRINFGRGTDYPMPADYDGDGATDLGLLRVVDGKWQWIIDTNRDGSTDRRINFGRYTDRPMPADYDGDGEVDLAVLRVNGTQWEWIVDPNHDGEADMRVKYGEATDQVFAGDWGGNAAADFGLVRVVNGYDHQWIVDTNHNGVTNIRKNFGNRLTFPFPADYNGDSKTDFAFLSKLGSFEGDHPDRWSWRADTNRDGTQDINVVFGEWIDVPLAADFNRDGAADFIVYAAVP